MKDKISKIIAGTALCSIIATTSVIKSESEWIASASNTCVLVIIPTTYLSITNTQFPKKLIIKVLKTGFTINN